MYLVRYFHNCITMHGFMSVKLKGNDLFRKRRTKEFRSISSHYNEWVKDSYGGKCRYKLLFWTLYVNRP